MKINYYKNKKPLSFKVFQITVLLIYGAISTAQAAKTVEIGLFNVNGWSSDGAGNSTPFEILIGNHGFFDDAPAIPFEVTIMYDEDAIDIDGGFGSTGSGGEITFSGSHFFPELGQVVAEFDIISLMGDLAFTTLTITSATLNSIPIPLNRNSPYKLHLPGGPPSISTVPLPAAFPLMLSAIAAVGFLGSKRKKLVPQN